MKVSQNVPYYSLEFWNFGTEKELFGEADLILSSFGGKKSKKDFKKDFQAE